MAEKATCPICCSDVAEKVLIKCPYCPSTACIKCLKTFIVTLARRPVCMNLEGCGKEWPAAFFTGVFPKSWIAGPYRRAHVEAIYNIERQQLPLMQDVATFLREAEAVNKHARAGLNRENTVLSLRIVVIRIVSILDRSRGMHRRRTGEEDETKVHDITGYYMQRCRQLSRQYRARVEVPAALHVPNLTLLSACIDLLQRIEYILSVDVTNWFQEYELCTHLIYNTAKTIETEITGGSTQVQTIAAYVDRINANFRQRPGYAEFIAELDDVPMTAYLARAHRRILETFAAEENRDAVACVMSMLECVMHVLHYEDDEVDEDVLARRAELVRQVRQPVTDAAAASTTTTADRVIQRRPCTWPDCHGFVKTSLCDVCGRHTCPSCFMPRDEGHQCRPENVESAQLIRKDTKSCPSCHVPIYRSMGCPQMWCTQCNTAFDWTTLRILPRTAVHNPHYFEWLARNRDREPAGVDCGAELDPLTALNRLLARRHVSEAALEIGRFAIELHAHAATGMSRFNPTDLYARARLAYFTSTAKGDRTKIFKTALVRTENAHARARYLMDVASMFVAALVDILQVSERRWSTALAATAVSIERGRITPRPATRHPARPQDLEPFQALTRDTLEQMFGLVNYVKESLERFAAEFPGCLTYSLGLLREPRRRTENRLVLLRVDPVTAVVTLATMREVDGMIIGRPDHLTAATLVATMD